MASDAEIRDAESELDRAEEALLEAKTRVKVARSALWNLVNSERPTVEGWYVDANDNPARFQGGEWDDGWGNGGPNYGYPAIPLRWLGPLDIEVMPTEEEQTDG